MSGSSFLPSMPMHLLTMLLSNIQIAFLWLLLALFALSEGKTLSAHSSVPLEIIKNGSLPSPWLQKTGRGRGGGGGGGGGDPRGDGCRNQPWICNRGQPPRARMRCCQNRCVDVSSDVNHCGLCGIRCPYTWACCRGRCRNINFNRFHCGGCFRRCPFRVRCLYGMCGYGEQTPPRPPRRPCPRKRCPPSPQSPGPPNPRQPRKPGPPKPPRGPQPLAE